MRPTPSITSLPLVALGTLLPAAAAAGQWSPDWVGTVPVGSALTAGMQGMVTDADGVTCITAIAGPSSNTDIVTAAFGPDGTPLWQATFNGPGNWHDQARGIGLGPGGTVYVTGNTPGPGNYANVLLLKYDTATGALLDFVQHSSGPFTSEHGATVSIDAAGNAYVGGGTVGDGGDGLMLGFDPSGAVRWSCTWDGPAWGPYSQDSIRQVQMAPDGNPVAMIHGVMGSLHPDYVVVKYRATDGAVLWQATWGVNGGDFAVDMAIDAAGDVYVTGTGIDFIDRYSTIKLRGGDGQLLWQAYDSIGAEDYASAVALDGAGGVYITGTSDPDGDESNFNDNFYTVKRDATTGERIWTHFYGANCIGCYDTAADVIADGGGNVLVVGSTSSPPYGGDMILFRLDASSGVELDRSVVPGGPEEFAAGGILQLDAAQNIYVGGGFGNFNTGAGTAAVFGYASLVAFGAPGDANGDGAVGIPDLLMVLEAWGPCAGCPEDFDHTQTVDIRDLLTVLANWG